MIALALTVTELFNKVCEVSEERKKERKKERQVKNKTYPPPMGIRNYSSIFGCTMIIYAGGGSTNSSRGGGGGVTAGILRGGSRLRRFKVQHHVLCFGSILSSTIVLSVLSGPSKVGGRRRFVAASNQSHRRLLFAES